MATKETTSEQLLQETSETRSEHLLIIDDGEQDIAMTTIAGFATIEMEDDTESQSVSTSRAGTEPLPLSRSRSLSNILNRSAPILFIKSHGKKMIGKQDPLEHNRDRSWTNWVVGISCTCFLMPSLTILILRAWNHVRICIIFDCIYFIIVAICSFLSDYVYCYVDERPCDFVTIDQWTATGGVIIVIIGIFINPYPLLIRLLDFIILFIALYLIGRSRKSTNKYQWRKRHCIWHLFGGIGLSYIYFQEYLLRIHVISSTNLWWPW